MVLMTYRFNTTKSLVICDCFTCKLLAYYLVVDVNVGTVDAGIIFSIYTLMLIAIKSVMY